jgi:hypothetical protein
MTFKSTFALLDVQAGRANLAKRIGKGQRIPVAIVGTINAQWGGDDGISMEFEVEVHSVKELKRPYRRR